MESLLGEEIRRAQAIYQDRGISEKQLNDILSQRWSVVAPVLRDMFVLASRWLTDIPPVPPVIANDAELDTFARELTAILGRPEKHPDHHAVRQSFRRTIEGSLDNWIRAARKQGRNETAKSKSLEFRVLEVESRLEEIANKYPHLDRDRAHFSPSPEKMDLPDAVQVFRALSIYADKWSRPLDDRSASLKRVAEAFSRVSASEAAKCAEILESWLEPRRRAQRERDSLIQERDKLRAAIPKYRSSSDARALEDVRKTLFPALNDLDEIWRDLHALREYQEGKEDRDKALEIFFQTLDALQRTRDKIERLANSEPDVLKSLRQRVDTVLWRFSLVEGVRPISLIAEKDRTGERSGGYAIRTADGRLLQHLSTGQRAQVGVSLLVAQNLAATNYLNNRVILLDDVTTAYDLSNLTREAILWRQLAYGAEDDGPVKRQIFISSHHEDMTNHLLDLLVPPHGRSMRLLRFTGWSPENGPTIETFRVEPSSELPPPGASRDAHPLKSALEAL